MGRFGPYDVLRVPARVTSEQDEHACHRKPLTMADFSMYPERAMSEPLGILDTLSRPKYPFPGIVDTKAQASISTYAFQHDSDCFHPTRTL